MINSHASVYNGLLLAGCEIVFIPSIYSKEYDIYLPTTSKQIKELIE
jgi:arginine/lysine/ornithine decarboxylase